MTGGAAPGAGAAGHDHADLARAYESGDKLQARIDIYEYQRPRVDFHRFTLDHADLSAGGRVLDVGCGTATALLQLADRPEPLTLVGVDQSPGMLSASRARDRRHRVQWVAGNVEALPVPDGAARLVLAMHMLYHVPDIDRAVGELRRVLRPGGTLLATTLGPSHMGELHALAAEALPGGTLDRPSHRFGLADDAILRRHFRSVEIDRLEGELVLPSAPPLVRYLDSARDLFEPALPSGVIWDEVVAYVEHRLSEEIAKQGEFRVHTESAVFVCN